MGFILRVGVLAAVLVGSGLQGPPGGVSVSALAADIDRLAAASEAEVIAWRRHLHANPELSNREVETAKAYRRTAAQLWPRAADRRRENGRRCPVKGGKAGAVVALRADMDGLPVREESNLPFASKAVGEYEGQPVGVMHACGHDTHMAIVLGSAKVLTSLKDKLTGSVKFIFQPAEEGAPAGERPAGAS